MDLDLKKKSKYVRNAIFLLAERAKLDLDCDPPTLTANVGLALYLNNPQASASVFCCWIRLVSA